MKNWLIFLSIVAPLAFISRAIGLPALITFALSAASLVPLGAMMERATEELADYLGPTLGGLLNATLGNAPELIIACMALSKGLQDVVKASLTGSILGNLLFANGVAMIVGGWGRPYQKFNHVTAGLNSGLLFLAVVALVIPAMFVHTTNVSQEISIQVSVVLMAVYVTNLVYTIARRQSPVPPEMTDLNPKPTENTPKSHSNVRRSVGLLILVTVGVAVISETLTDAIEPTANMLGLTSTFTGVFLLASAGNIAQILNAVQFARSDNMELTLATTVGSSIQVVLLVAPVLVFVSYAMGRPMDLVFSRLELFGLFFATISTRNTTADGISNLMEGVLLLGVYALLGIAFFVK